MVVKYMVVDTDKITANEYKKHLYVKYEDQPFFIQTEWMTLQFYGVPNKDKYHLTEQSRRYIKLSLHDPEFTKFILGLDTYFTSEKFKSKYLSEKQMDFSYIPLYKPGSENYSPFIKLKISVDDNDNVLSEIFHKNENEFTKCEIKNMDDLKSCFPYNCDYRIVFKVNKIWFMSKTYGVQLKLMKAQIKPKNKQINDIEFEDE